MVAVALCVRLVVLLRVGWFAASVSRCGWCFMGVLLVLCFADYLVGCLLLVLMADSLLVCDLFNGLPVVGGVDLDFLD